MAMAICFAKSAHAQDYFALFGTGVEAKATAGAGLLAARGAPATFYNPANLMLAEEGLSYDSVLDIVSIDYQYQFPGKHKTRVQQTVPVPFFGATWRSPKFDNLAVSGSFLPIPGGGSKQKIDDVWLRILPEDEPQNLNIQSEGEGKLGYRASVGAAYEAMPGLKLGMAIQAFRSSSRIQGDDARATLEPTIFRSNSTVRREAIVFGCRGSALKGRLQGVLTLNPGAITHIDENRELTQLGAELDNSSVKRGPLGIGAGVEGRIWSGFSALIELEHEQWSRLRSQKLAVGTDKVEADYFDSTDLKLGASYRNGGQSLRAGAGVYQSHLGQGIMKKYSANGEASLGQTFADVDSLPYVSYALGYSVELEAFTLKSALSYSSGSREVWEKAVGAGHYNLTLMSLSLGLAMNY